MGPKELMTHKALEANLFNEALQLLKIGRSETRDLRGSLSTPAE